MSDDIPEDVDDESENDHEHADDQGVEEEMFADVDLSDLATSDEPILISRDCSTCGESFTVGVTPDGEYQGGQFYGQFELPAEGAEIIDEHVIEVAGTNVNVVEYNNYRPVEHWECDVCYRPEPEWKDDE